MTCLLNTSSRTSEDVLPGHPDRVCDSIAEAIVEVACTHDSEALVGVEVALHRHMVYVTGRVAAGGGFNSPVHLTDETLHSIVSNAFATAGYKDRWRHDVTVASDLDIGPLEDDERAIRRYSDDQGIATGYADPFTPDLLPLEHSLSRAAKRALAVTRDEHSDLLGPDGKVLVRLDAGHDRMRISLINIAIQHVNGVGFSDLYRLLVPHLSAALDPYADFVELPTQLNQDSVRVNGIGDFTCGGPMGDNGLSGKKLVVDHYGPHVPIGGGALCGKDAHKPDRVGPLRARQVALRLARATRQAALVHLGWLPGLEHPDRVWAVLEDGTVLEEDAVANTVRVPDLSLAGSARDLELAYQPWQEVMRLGYFGNEGAWEF